MQRLREALYPKLARIANAWQERLGDPARFEPTLAGFLRRCHAEGQTRPTPLLLHYESGGFNNLHQDLYGAIAFPLQVTILLSRPGVDFEGGEFLLVEQRPRQQSRGCAVALERGEAIVFATRDRPVEGRARRLSRGAAPRREPAAGGPPDHTWHHLPRRYISGARPPPRRTRATWSGLFITSCSSPGSARLGLRRLGSVTDRTPLR